MQTEPHILVADDEPDIRELVGILLREAGFRVSVTDSTSVVLGLTSNERFDAILLDNWMPELTGVELCRQIRTFDQRTPILICSGSVTPADKQAAILAGAQGYVVKPFRADELIQFLRTVLEPQVLSSQS